MLPVLHRFVQISVNSKYSYKLDPFQKLCRHLFSQDSLRINSFKESCKNILSTIPDAAAFKTDMKIKCQKDIHHLIFLENLRKMIAVSKDDDDLALLGQMFKKYSNQNKLVRFGEFKLGPELMRLYYVLNKPKEALELIKDPQMSQNITEISSYVILGDLLFTNKMYEETLDLVNLFINMQFLNTRYPSNMVILYFASCYKLNSPESLEKGLALWQKLMQVEYKCPMKGIWFFSMLAFNQKKPDLTLEIITPPISTPVGNNIKMLAMSEKKMYDMVISLIKSEFLSDSPQLANHNFITSDTLTFVENAFEAAPEVNQKQLSTLKDDLLAHNFVKEEPLETFLMEECHWIPKKKPRLMGKQQR